MVCDVDMGWEVTLIAKPIAQAIEPMGLKLLLAGGISYTEGISVYAIKVKYMHSVWHFFVLGGSILHFLSILLYVI